MSHIIDGKAIANTILEQVKKRVATLDTPPKLAVVLVGDDKPSKTYVRKKQEAAEAVGITFEKHAFPADISKDDLIKEVRAIQKDKTLSGLIVQLPLPEPLYTTEVLNAVKPELDVDCLTDVNLGKLIMKTHTIAPPTPGAVFAILDTLNVDLVGKNVTIIGMGALVGKPLAVMMANARASVTSINQETKNVKDKCRQADIIITGVGKRNILTKDMVRRGTIIIDTGICFENKKMYGDVDFDKVRKKASHITPVPGGVGPITVALLLQNTTTCAQILS